MKMLELLDIESDVGEELTDAELFKVLKDYEEGLNLPDRKAGPFLVLLVGLIGVGKTTTAKELQKYLPAARFRSDDVREILLRKGFNLLRTRDIMEIVYKKYLQAGYGIIADNDAAGPTARRLVSQAEALGVSTAWVHIVVPEGVAEARLRDGAGSAFRGEEGVELYHKRKILHENLDMPFVGTIDTSKDDFEEQVLEVVKKINNKLGLNP